eukprot:scaffold177_cov334-Pavlova_lutheri.AAC.29
MELSDPLEPAISTATSAGICGWKGTHPLVAFYSDPLLAHVMFARFEVTNGDDAGARVSKQLLTTWKQVRFDDLSLYLASQFELGNKY